MAIKLTPVVICWQIGSLGSDQNLYFEKQAGWQEVGWRAHKHAGSVTDLVIHLTNTKQSIFEHLHDGVPPLDGQTCQKVGSISHYFCPI